MARNPIKSCYYNGLLLLRRAQHLFFPGCSGALNRELASDSAQSIAVTSSRHAASAGVSSRRFSRAVFWIWQRLHKVCSPFGS